MPVKKVTPYMIEPGKCFRNGESLLVVDRCEFCNKSGSMFDGKWISHMRPPTKEERIISDVMQT